MKKATKRLIITASILTICFAPSLSLSAQEEKKTLEINPNSNVIHDEIIPIPSEIEKQYTDVNKKILNVGGSSYHLVKKGDTVWGILIRENHVNPNHYNYYKEELLKLNPQIKDVNKIISGEKLLIPQTLPKKNQKIEIAKEEKTPPQKEERAKEEAPVAQEKKAPTLKKPSRKADSAKKEPPKSEPLKSEPPKAEPVKREPQKVEAKPLKIMAEASEGATKKDDASKPDVKKEPLESESLTKEIVAPAPPKSEPPKTIQELKEADKDNEAESNKANIGGNADNSASKVAAVIMDADTENVITALAGGEVAKKGITYIPLADRAPLKIDTARTPIVKSNDKRIVLDYDDKINQADEEAVKNKFKYYEFVNASSADSAEVIVGKVLKASGYYSVRESKEIKIGKNVKLIIGYDWLIEKTPDSFLNGDVKVMNVKSGDEDKAPSYIKEYMQKYGFFVSEVKVQRKDGVAKPQKKNGTIVSLDEGASARKTVKNMLEIMNITHKENSLLKFQDEGDASIIADFYFESGDKKYAITLGQALPKLKDSAEKHNLTLLPLDVTQTVPEVIQNILNTLQKDYKYGTFRLIEDGDESPFLDVELKGFLLGKDAVEKNSSGDSYYTLTSNPDKIFIAYNKFPIAIERFVADCGYKFAQK